MTEQEIRDGAPPTATHYSVYKVFFRDDVIIYYKKINSHWVQFINDVSYMYCDARTLLDIKPLP